MPHIDNSKKSAFKFIILLGIVSLLADITYEGARSITGQYLAILGASGAVVGIVAGFFFFKGNDKKNQTEQEDILNQFTKGQLKNTDDLNMRINKNKPEKIVPGASQPLPGAATASEPTPSAETEASGAARRLTPPKTPVSGADSRGSNFHKDQEIIAKYEEINPAAAAAGSGRTDGVAVPPPWGSSLLPSAAAGSPAPGQQPGCENRIHTR